MDTTTPESSHLYASSGGAARLSAAFWVAIAAAALQITAIASDFYAVGESGSVADAWFGIPHTADLILGSALVTLVLAGLTAAGRSPMRGRRVGLFIGVVGLLATAQLVYRMVLPPFGGCLTFVDCTSARQSVELLPGIWFGLVGCIGATVGGFGHAFSRRAGATTPNFWVAREQAGLTPALATGAVAAAVAFVVGYAGFGFYVVAMGDSDPTEWSGWLATPHTSSLILVLVLATLALVWAATRGRAPMAAGALGATIAVLGFAAATRILYRIVVPPFYSGRPDGVFQEGAEIQLTAWISLIAALVWLAAGIAQVMMHRDAVDRGVDASMGQTA